MKETDVEFLQKIKAKIKAGQWLTFGESLHLLSLAEAGPQQTATQLLREAQEELRLIRMKDTNAVYDPTLRIRMSLFLDNPAPPSAPVLPEPFKHPQCPRCRSLPPLRMLQQVPLIWICDCCTQAFNGELKLWSIADAVLPEGQPQSVTMIYEEAFNLWTCTLCETSAYTEEELHRHLCPGRDVLLLSWKSPNPPCALKKWS